VSFCIFVCLYNIVTFFHSDLSTFFNNLRTRFKHYNYGALKFVCVAKLCSHSELYGGSSVAPWCCCLPVFIAQLGKTSGLPTSEVAYRRHFHWSTAALSCWCMDRQIVLYLAVCFSRTLCCRRRSALAAGWFVWLCTWQSGTGSVAMANANIGLL